MREWVFGINKKNRTYSWISRKDNEGFRNMSEDDLLDLLGTLEIFAEDIKERRFRQEPNSSWVFMHKLRQKGDER
jgi:hypothetical protein